MQSLPLAAKVRMTENRIIDWVREYDEDGVWKPNKQGLGMGHVFDELNKIYGEGFIKYK